ncbi:MAG: hypothetical protein GTO55_02740 [Armatimonadetes bacterium]|nr:hypothetical protein [Armatimonadota bacterium]NIM23194.1 hypothetical protein [Armatimonadota bacterium]NIM67062.1 hypothetical protein [Armatimonadota bacterium]NIM75596.1 hypothetical protein [Armatimonadota bacterium]NIN05251.1 hypothetical protein [Armatimonadota bacterium]
MEERTVCEMCDNPPEDEGYELPLCANCRDELSRCPFPLWVKLISGLVLLLVLIAFVNFPSSLRAAAAFERGNKAKSKGNYPTAILEYERALARFPDSTVTMAPLAAACGWDGDLRKFAYYLEKLDGREIRADLADEIEEILLEFEDLSEMEGDEQ